MTNRHWMLGFRIAALLALGTSVALLLDYTSSQPSFCTGQGGCAAVRQSAWAYLPLGGRRLPLPLLGVVAFGTVFALSLWPEHQAWRRFGRPLVFLMAASALALIGLQVAWGQICPLCMVVDGSALVMAVLTTMILRSRTGIPGELVTRGAWAGLAGLVLLAALLFPRFVRKTEIPATITELYVPGRMTVVEFFDFQCPHCRDLSPRLKSLLAADYPDAVLRYGYVPLPQHSQARYAARLSICAGEQGAEVEMHVTGLFFAATDLSSEHLRELARGAVDDAVALDACMDSTRPDVRIAADTERLKAAGFVGLPTTYVGGLRLLGAESNETFRAALERVRAGEDRSGMNPWVYWSAFLGLALGVALIGRAPTPARPSEGADTPSHEA